MFFLKIQPSVSFKTEIIVFQSVSLWGDLRRQWGAGVCEGSMPLVWRLWPEVFHSGGLTDLLWFLIWLYLLVLKRLNFETFLGSSQEKGGVSVLLWILAVLGSQRLQGEVIRGSLMRVHAPLIFCNCSLAVRGKWERYGPCTFFTKRNLFNFLKVRSFMCRLCSFCFFFGAYVSFVSWNDIDNP